MRRLALLLASAALLLAACATQGPDLDPWVGRHVNDAISSWGPPDTVSPGFSSMTFYTWEAATIDQTTTPRRTFTVDGDGDIVAWSAE